jgi:hypothetical protein
MAHPVKDSEDDRVMKPKVAGVVNNNEFADQLPELPEPNLRKGKPGHG